MGRGREGGRGNASPLWGIKGRGASETEMSSIEPSAQSSCVAHDCAAHDASGDSARR